MNSGKFVDLPVAPVLIAGQWQASQSSSFFQAENPATKEQLPVRYPVSSWSDCDRALDAAAAAAVVLRRLPAEQIAAFLERFAEGIEKRKEDLVEIAHTETALPRAPRLADVELPRTTNQLRGTAAAAREGSWARPTIDSAANIRSCYAALGPVCVFGPNNFPFAFGSASGGDFAAAIAAGNPVIAKANSSHPGTTRLFAELAAEAIQATGLPPATVQLLYRTDHADGERLVSDPRVGATGYTGSRFAGLKLKAAADRAGKPIYLELSSVNPVVILPGALRERAEKIIEEFTGSCLMGTGQFCTNPGLVLLLRESASSAFTSAVAERFRQSPSGTLLSSGVARNLAKGLATLQAAGARLLAGDQPANGKGYCHPNSLLEVTGQQFLLHPHELQTEAFGNASLVVVCEDLKQLCAAIDQLEGNLTGCIYSHTGQDDNAACEQVTAHLRPRVGRLLNDKMPTGVAVSPAMNHGGPFPATGHPGFTAVGIPAALIRFGMLQCYDNVREAHLPLCLRNKNPNGRMWRLIDGQWTQGDVGDARSGA